MKYRDAHPSDEELLSDIDGELSPRDERSVRAHVNACWRCRARRQEFEAAVGIFARTHRSMLEGSQPQAVGYRALLKARLAEISAAEDNRNRQWSRTLAALAWAGVIGCMVVGLWFGYGILERRRLASQRAVVSTPNARLTPGAALLASRYTVCLLPEAGNKAVPAELQREVFDEYGISGSDPHAYEVDYLVTPALGGADDIRNLWPHSYSATWNAHVKDALEDRLRRMVCDGNLDLAEAQREIAADWIGAYKKYFHTDKPLLRDLDPQ